MIRLSLLSSNFVRRSLFRLSSNCKRELLSIVREEVSDHHGAYGIDSIKMLKIKIHKHYKGKNYCKGSDRTITTPLDKVNDNKVHYN